MYKKSQLTLRGLASTSSFCDCPHTEKSKLLSTGSQGPRDLSVPVSLEALPIWGKRFLL